MPSTLLSPHNCGEADRAVACERTSEKSQVEDLKLKQVRAPAFRRWRQAASGSRSPVPRWQPWRQGTPEYCGAILDKQQAHTEELARSTVKSCSNRIYVDVELIRHNTNMKTQGLLTGRRHAEESVITSLGVRGRGLCSYMTPTTAESEFSMENRNEIVSTASTFHTSLKAGKFAEATSRSRHCRGESEIQNSVITTVSSHRCSQLILFDGN